MPTSVFDRQLSSCVKPRSIHAPSDHYLAIHEERSDAGSQSAFAAIGGYSLPSFSIFGSHVHRSSTGTLSIMLGTWLPQPHQEVFSKIAVPVSIFGLCSRLPVINKSERCCLRHVVHVPFLHMLRYVLKHGYVDMGWIVEV